MLDFAEIKDWIALSTIEGIGPRRFVSLVEHFGSPGKVLSASEKRLSEIPDIGKTLAFNIKKGANRELSEKQITLLKKHQFDFLIYKDKLYPQNLKNIFDFPPFLFVKGEIKKEDKNSIAIVGTRIASHYGKSIAKSIACELSQMKITIVSGMARGIDSVGHLTALDMGGRTIAVFGSGLDLVYPKEHEKLAEKISENGALLSEFLLGTKPMAENFPKRNRLISGLSLGVVVVEAPKKSGALLTARYALDQGREVFAIPGNIGSKRSEGTNWLIKQGASLVSSVDDILSELENVLKIHRGKIEEDKVSDLSFEEKKIFNLLSLEPSHIDSIAKNGEIDTPQALTVLLSLELKGLVKQLSGKMFVKNRG